MKPMACMINTQATAHTAARVRNETLMAERALRFVRENRSNIFGLAALVALDDHAVVIGLAMDREVEGRALIALAGIEVAAMHDQFVAIAACPRHHVCATGPSPRRRP